MKETELLRNAGCENVEGYTLVNNYGYTFNKNGLKFDLRHWLNCYGANVDYYSLNAYNKETKEYVKLDKHTFNDFNEALQFIKTI